uniref:NADH-ubiquinone oxidoreductase chain 1 n=1 Tax=Strigamia maritima TaxID=126957 RepID=T1IN33_STRMM
MGVLQAIIDGVKLLKKEQLMPLNSAEISFLSVPDLNILFYFFVGIVSKSKYGIIGAIRASRQSISYEIAFSLYILCIVVHNRIFRFFRSFRLSLLAVYIPFLIIIIAELNRAPFDFSEGESELVSGYNVEFARVVFVLLFLSEYDLILVIYLFYFKERIINCLVKSVFSYTALLPLRSVISITTFVILLTCCFGGYFTYSFCPCGIVEKDGDRFLKTFRILLVEIVREFSRPLALTVRLTVNIIVGHLIRIALYQGLELSIERLALTFSKVPFGRKRIFVFDTKGFNYSTLLVYKKYNSEEVKNFRSIVLAFQILTGTFLAMYYRADRLLAFSSVQYVIYELSFKKSVNFRSFYRLCISVSPNEFLSFSIPWGLLVLVLVHLIFLHDTELLYYTVMVIMIKFVLSLNIEERMLIIFWCDYYFFFTIYFSGTKMTGTVKKLFNYIFGNIF